MNTPRSASPAAKVRIAIGASDNLLRNTLKSGQAFDKLKIGEDLHELSDAGFDMEKIHLKHNPSMAQLYEDAIKFEGAVISSTGALINFSGKKTGRSPKDKRIVSEETSKNDIWWGPVNVPMTEHVFEINRERAIDYLNTRPEVYVVDAYAGWDPKYRLKVRVIASRAYHAAFMTVMLVRPTAEELANFGEPDFTIYNAGQFPANRFTAGEMKKGIFSVMHYLQPVKFGNLSLHSSCNGGNDGDVTLFFGLSGTGKTTLSADPHRKLIGDDEHVVSPEGVFCIEGGCYAKTLDLSAEKEPDIFGAIRFGCILENVTYDEDTRECDYNDFHITENSRAAYPIEFIANHKPGGLTRSMPANIIFLTCDAFGVLPPVSLLSAESAQYHFVAGYTSKTPGTEQGIVEPTPTFSACYGQPFLVLHPGKYATMLAELMEKNKIPCWLINTGWTGGKFGIGSRCPLKYTRAIIDAIHDGTLMKEQFENFPVFNFSIPKQVKGVPSKILNPSRAWTDIDAFNRELVKVAQLFSEAFLKYESGVSTSVLKAGPIITQD